MNQQNQQPSVEDRLRHALHDLDRRVAETVADAVTARQQQPVQLPGSLPRKAGPRPRNRWNLPRLVPALTALAVVAVLSVTGWLLRPGAAAAPIPGVTATATPTPSPVSSQTPAPDPMAVLDNLPDVVSQSAADGHRDGIYPGVAALHLPERVVPDAKTDYVVYAATPEGIWVISKPDVTGFAKDPVNNCLPRSAGIAYTICPGSYSEILLLASDGSKLLKAYPIPELATSWLYVTPDAIYCGTPGVETLVEMVCRIDRSTGTFTGRLFAFPGSEAGPGVVVGWPGNWKVSDVPADFGSFGQARLGDGVLTMSSGPNDTTAGEQLDGVTLAPANHR